MRTAAEIADEVAKWMSEGRAAKIDRVMTLAGSTPALRSSDTIVLGPDRGGLPEWRDFGFGSTLTADEIASQAADNLRATRASRIQRYRCVSRRLRAKRFHAGA